MERSPSPKLLTLQIIHAALGVGATLFLAVAFLINQNQLVWMPDANNSLMLYIGIGISAVNIMLSTVLYNNLLAKIDTSLPVSKTFPSYTTALIVRCALLEGATLFNTAVFMVTGNLINAALSALLILIIIAVRPQRQHVVETLKIQYPETLD